MDNDSPWNSNDEMPIENPFEEFIKNDDLYGLFKTNGNNIMKTYSRTHKNESEIQLEEFLTQHYNIKKIIDYLADLCDLEVSLTSVKLLTHSSNRILMDEIVNNVELLDYFFGKAYESTTPELYDVYYYSLFRYPNCNRLLPYFNSMKEDYKNDQDRYNLDLNSNTRGYFFIKSLCQNIQIEHIYRLLISIYTMMETPVPWYRELNFNVSLIMADKLRELSSIPYVEFKYDDYVVCDLIIQFMVSIINIEALDMRSKFHQFTKLLVDIIFKHDPSPISHLCLLLFNSLLSQTFNLQSYKSTQLPIILSSLLEKCKASHEFINRLYLLNYHLNNPVMQISQDNIGIFRLKLIETVNLLIQTNYGLIHEELFKSGIMTSLLEKLFEKSDIVGNRVNEIIQNIFYCDDSDMVLEWIKNTHLVDRLIEGFEKHKHSIPRLIGICLKLKRVSDIIPQFADYLDSHEKWNEFFKKSVEYYADQYKDLGNINI